MIRRENLSTLIAISVVLLVPLALVGMSVARDSDSSVALAHSTHDHDGKAFMGVVLEEETEHPEGGARITQVVDDSGADEAGLEKGDIIVEFDGKTVRGPMSLANKIHDLEPGDEVEVTILRDGRERIVDVELGESPGHRVFSWDGDVSEALGKAFEVLDCDDDDDDCPSYSFSCSGDDCEGMNFHFGSWNRSGPMLGVQIAGITEELREHMGSDGDTGVLVSRVVAGSPAEDGGVSVGDLIVSVDGESVEDVGDIRDALDDSWGKTIEVGVIRDGRSRSVDVTMPEADDDGPSGPQAFYYRFGDDDGYSMNIAREAIREAQALTRNTMREARSVHREAMGQAREAMKAARKASRGARNEARSAYREALGAYRSTVL